jgi:LCP family protein required for cell wall assembly
MSKRITYFLILLALISIIAALIFIDVKALTAKITVALSNYNQNDFTVLVLGEAGKGGGGQWEQAPDLTDTIILVRFTPKDNVVDLVSIPRDLYGTFGTSTFKVNEVLERNKLSEFMDKLSDITGISTNKFMVVDLLLVKNIVDAVGGIDVDLPNTVADPVGDYSITAGLHHLDGSDVEWLIRNRFAPEGDFFREDNQHLIIEAILKKFLSLNFIEQTKLVVALSPEINKLETNVNLGEVYPLISEGKDLSFRSAILDFSTGLVESSSTSVADGSQYILVPYAGINNYGKIRDYITLQLQPAQPSQQNPLP